MTNTAIQVDNLGKRYRIGAEEQRPQTAWAAVRHAAASRFEYLRRITRPPTEGEAVINGRVGSLLEVGTGFHPELTGRENVDLSGARRGLACLLRCAGRMEWARDLRTALAGRAA